MSKMGIKINAADVLRGEYGWSYDEVATALDVTPEQVKEWEDNQFRTGP